MGTLITTDLQEIGNSRTDTRPAMVLIATSGEPNYILAWKGPNSTDEIHLSGVAGPDGTSTDAAPALAAIDVYGTTMLYLAWKVPGSSAGVKVMQCNMGGNIPVPGHWGDLPVAAGKSSVPDVSTDAAPAIAVAADNQLYMVWKTPGGDAAMQWSVYDGHGWSSPEAIPDAKTNASPALAAWDAAAWPLCLAWKGSATDGVFWSSFTPGSSSFTQNEVPGSATDAAPALTTGLVGKSYYVVWKTKGEGSLSFAPLDGTTVGTTTTLMQVETDEGPAAVNWSNDTSGFGAYVFNNLILAWKGKTTGDVWKGAWALAQDPVAAPAAGLGSNSNYFFYCDCNDMKGVSVTLTATQNMVADNGFGMQLNAYSSNSKNYYSASQQYIIRLAATDNPPQLKCFVNNWHSNTIAVIDAQVELFALKENKLPAGYQLTISLGEDSSGDIDTATFTVVDNLQNQVATHTITLLDETTPAQQQKDLAPIVAFQLNLVGYSDGGSTKFSSGEGTIAYTAAKTMTVLSSEPHCVEQGFITEETGNTFYGVLPATPAIGFTQTFTTSNVVQMIRKAGTPWARVLGD